MTNNIPEFEDFCSDFKSSYQNKKEELSEGPVRPFVALMADSVCAESVNLVYIDQNDCAVDGYFETSSEDDPHAPRSLTLIVADFHDFSSKSVLTQREAETLLNKLVNFFDAATKGQFIDEFDETMVEERELVKLIYNVQNGDEQKRFVRLELFIFSDRASEIVDVASLNVKASQFNVYIDVRVKNLHSLYDAAKSLHESTNQKQIVEKVDTVDIVLEKPLNLQLVAVGDGYKSYTGAIPGPVLADWYLKYGSRILENNVRSYLGARASVNRGIKETLKTEPQKFFIYNNGIVLTAHDIVCDSLKPQQLGQSYQVTRLHGLQIINGGQTTASIALSRKEKVDISEVYVQVKLTVIDQNSNVSKTDLSTLTENISRYANSQNAIKASDYSMSGKLPKQIEALAKNTPIPSNGSRTSQYWYFERARGSFMCDKSFLFGDKKREFNKKYAQERIVKPAEIARAWFLRSQMPQVCALSAQKNYAMFHTALNASYDELFSRGFFDQEWFKEMIAFHIMIKQLPKLLHGSGHPTNSVCYAISYFCYWIENKFSVDKTKPAKFNYEKIWQAQSVPSDLKDFLIKIASTLREHVIAPLGKNASEYQKKEDCWKETIKYFEKHPLHVPVSIETYIVKPSSTKNLYNFPYWQEAFEFAATHKCLAPSEAMMINYLIVGRRNLVKERDLEPLRQLLLKIIDMGFPHSLD